MGSSSPPPHQICSLVMSTFTVLFVKNQMDLGAVPPLPVLGTPE